MTELGPLGIGHDQRVTRGHFEHPHECALARDGEPGLIELLERQELAGLADGRSLPGMLALQDHVVRPFAGLSHSRWSSMALAPMAAPEGSEPVI